MFADDSAKDQAFKDATKKNEKKDDTFRQALPREAEFSHDLGVPAAELLNIKEKSHPTMIIELKSKKPREEEEVVQFHSMAMASFASPDRVRG